MVAATVMQCEHSPYGGIQWLLVNPEMCSIGRCAPHCNAASMWHRVFFVVFDFLSLIIIAKDYRMVHMI